MRKLSSSLHEGEDWRGTEAAEILGCLADCGVMSLGELCERVGVSEGEMIACLAMLARERRIRISQVELPA